MDILDDKDRPMMENTRYTSTEDSRFHTNYYRTGTHKFFAMYSGNIVIEGDGLAYPELNILRTLIVEPYVVLIIYFSSLIAYIAARRRQVPRLHHPWASIFHWVVGSLLTFILLFNLIRIVSTIFCLLLELFLWPFRVCLGQLFAPITTLFSAGHLYALSYQNFIRSGCTTRRVKVNNSVRCRIRPTPVSCLGNVIWFEAQKHSDACYIASILKLQQRCGTGPECILLDGTNVFVSWWRPWTITSFVRGNETAWSLWDIPTMKWRKMVFDFHIDQFSSVESTASFSEQGDDEFIARPINFLVAPYDQQNILSNMARNVAVLPSSLEWLHDIGTPVFHSSDENCGEISTLHELEEYYNSPLGWNKYHRMRKEGNKIRVPRPDRRIASHFLAFISSLFLYFWYKDSSRGRLGLFIDLHALIVANYVFITAYAGKILLGAYSEVVDAKSDRYGIIVTRAIDQGYVRGFHVPNGNWLIYKNGKKDSEVHEITKTEINATCNSIVKEEGNEIRIKVIGYDDRLVEELSWSDP